MDPSDLLALALIAAAVAVGTVSGLVQCEEDPTILLWARELGFRVGLAGSGFVSTLVVGLVPGMPQTGLLATIPVSLLALEAYWALHYIRATSQDE